MEKRTDIEVLKTPTKWEILKAKSKHIKQYLRGRIVPGTAVTAAPRIEVSTSKYDNKDHLREYRKRRKKLKKISYKSRRKNRSGL